LDRIFDVYGSFGLPVPITIHLGRDFVDDYIDFLIKSGHIQATGVSGQDLAFHKAK
jgi:hypothetical protein